MPPLDAALGEAAAFHCTGGFAVSQHYGFGRETADLNVLSAVPRPAGERDFGFPRPKNYCYYCNNSTR
jgi:hypothetical protein